MVFRIIGGLLSRVVAEKGIPYLLYKKTALKNSGCRGIDSRCCYFIDSMERVLVAS
jgi:hypothetical protein